MGSMTLEPAAGLSPDATDDYALPKKEIASRITIVRLNDGFHLVEMIGNPAHPVRPWPGPFQTRAAAELFCDDLVEALIHGEPEAACCSSGIFEYFNIAGRILEIIAGHTGTQKSLALALTAAAPWATPLECHDENPF